MGKSRRGGEKWMKTAAAFWAQYRRAGITPMCALCGHAIDINTSGRTVYSKSVDHIVPVEQGGREFDIRNCQPTHYLCNVTRQMRPMTEFATPRQRAAFRTVIESLSAVQTAKQAHKELNNSGKSDYVFTPWGWGFNEKTDGDSRYYSCCGTAPTPETINTTHVCP